MRVGGSLAGGGARGESDAGEPKRDNEGAQYSKIRTPEGAFLTDSGPPSA